MVFVQREVDFTKLSPDCNVALFEERQECVREYQPIRGEIAAQPTETRLEQAAFWPGMADPYNFLFDRLAGDRRQPGRGTQGNWRTCWHRTIFISDIHLGTRGCKAEALVKFPGAKRL